MNAKNKVNVNDRSEAYHAGYKAHEQGEPRSNVTAHYEAGTRKAGEWIDGWEAALCDLHMTGAE